MTMIDKAEALALIDRKLGKDHPALADELRHAIRALPARGVGVPTDCRKWDCYPIEMPLTKDGHGPAIPGKDEIASITYEVWDRTLETHASFDNLPDAINEAMRLSLAALAPTDAAQAREAAQPNIVAIMTDAAAVAMKAREAALRDASDAIKAKVVACENPDELRGLCLGEAAILALISEART